MGISVSSRTAWSTELFQDKDIYREPVSKSQKLKEKIKEIEIKIGRKPLNGLLCGKNICRLKVKVLKSKNEKKE